MMQRPARLGWLRRWREYKRQSSAWFFSLARWQSGDAEDCKSSYSGSIPLRASIYLFIVRLMRLSFSRISGFILFLAVLSGCASSAPRPSGIAQEFCSAVQSGNQAAIESLLSPSLLRAVQRAQRHSDAIQKSKPKEKPPLGDGIPYQSYPDRADRCEAGLKITSAIQEIRYLFAAYPDADWTDRIVLVKNKDGAAQKIDDILYAPDYKDSLRNVVKEVLAQH